MLVSDPICYNINSISLGDTLAAAPVVKWAIENFHQQADYKVLAKPYYRELFHFVPDDKFGNQGELHSFKANWMIRNLNTPRGGPNPRTTSMRMHLTLFASIQLLDRIVPHLVYLPLPKVPVDHFKIDFSKAVLIIVTYRDEVRRISFEAVSGIASWVQSQGLIPVYIGKEDDSPMWKDSPFKKAFDQLPGNGIDLLNKTSILELASIMGQAKAVVGIDSGPIHIAGTTTIPIVCGYTTVSPECRVPLRTKGLFYPIAPALPCKHCQSAWNVNYHDFGFCPLNDLKCAPGMTAGKFIAGLKKVLNL